VRLFDIRIHAIRHRRNRRRPFEVRWHAAGRIWSKSLIARGLADSYRALLVRAARRAWHSTLAPGSQHAGPSASLPPELVPACGRLRSDEMATCSAAGPSPPVSTIGPLTRGPWPCCRPERAGIITCTTPTRRACATVSTPASSTCRRCSSACRTGGLGHKGPLAQRWPAREAPPPRRARQTCAGKPRPGSRAGSAPDCLSPLTRPGSPGPGAFWPADGAAWTPRSKPWDHTAAFAFVRLLTVCRLRRAELDGRARARRHS
jgi:hypothetical protein